MPFNRKILAAMSITLAGMAFLPTSSNATFTDPNAASDDIVVTGSKVTKEEISAFVRTTISTPKGGRHKGQYARFQGAVCPKVVGLSEENIKQVERRMRGVALAADMQVAAEGCAPNVYVMVVADGNEAISMLRKKRSQLFGDISHYERERIAKSGGPAYAWKRIQASSAEAGVLQNSNDVSILPVDTPAKTYVPTLTSNVKSRIKRTITQAMTHSFLLLEKGSLVDLTTIQIADYAAMRSYMDTRDGKTAKAPAYSILSLFDAAAGDGKMPVSISELDLVLLSSLYHSPADVSAAMQSSAMINRFEKELNSNQED